MANKRTAPANARMSQPIRLDLANEFAHVTLELVENGNGARLRLRDNGTQRAIDFDPMVLAALVWLNNNDLERIVDPQFAIESAMRGQPEPECKFRKAELARRRS
jgi:hypothetical protein